MKFSCIYMLCASALLLIGLAGCGGGGGSSGGSPSLTWVASNSYAPSGYTWPQADSFCNTLILNSQTGWRLPTQAELTAFAKSHQIGSSNQYNPGGSVVNVWSSSSGQTQFTHLYVDINDSTGTAYQAADSTGYSVYCVK